MTLLPEERQRIEAIRERETARVVIRTAREARADLPWLLELVERQRRELAAYESRARILKAVEP